MKTGTIKIKGKAYKVRYSLRAMFIFEAIAKRPFEITSLIDNYILLYSIILANNPENPLDWEVFLDACDEDPNLIGRISGIVEESRKVDNVINSTDDDNDKEDGAEKKS